MIFNMHAYTLKEKTREKGRYVYVAYTKSRRNSKKIKDKYGNRTK